MTVEERRRGAGQERWAEGARTEDTNGRCGLRRRGDHWGVGVAARGAKEGQRMRCRMCERDLGLWDFPDDYDGSYDVCFECARSLFPPHRPEPPNEWPVAEAPATRRPVNRRLRRRKAAGAMGATTATGGHHA